MANILGDDRRAINKREYRRILAHDPMISFDRPAHEKLLPKSDASHPFLDVGSRDDKNNFSFWMREKIFLSSSKNRFIAYRRYVKPMEHTKIENVQFSIVINSLTAYVLLSYVFVCELSILVNYIYCARVFFSSLKRNNLHSIN